MSRNDRRRGGRDRNWGNRDNNSEKIERKNPESHSNERSERRHENRGSASYERRQERRRSQNQVNQKEIEENLFDLTSINYLNVKFCLSFNITVYPLAHFQV